VQRLVKIVQDDERVERAELVQPRLKAVGAIHHNRGGELRGVGHDGEGHIGTAWPDCPCVMHGRCRLGRPPPFSARLIARFKSVISRAVARR
jgi:hypothetical protein